MARPHMFDFKVLFAVRYLKRNVIECSYVKIKLASNHENCPILHTPPHNNSAHCRLSLSRRLINHRFLCKFAESNRFDRCRH